MNEQNILDGLKPQLEEGRDELFYMIRDSVTGFPINLLKVAADDVTAFEQLKGLKLVEMTAGGIPIFEKVVV